MGKHRWPTAGTEGEPSLKPLARIPRGEGWQEDRPGYQRCTAPEDGSPEDSFQALRGAGAPDPVGPADEPPVRPRVRWRVARSAALVFLGVALVLGAALLLVRGSEPSTAAVSVPLDGGGQGVPAAPTTPAARPAPGPATAASDGGRGPEEVPDAMPSGSTPGSAGPEAVVVYVTGAVSSPGVVTVPHGTRLFDVIEASGGALPEADLESINLAGIPSDGEHIHLLAAGEEPRAAQAAPDPPSGAAAGGPVGAGATGGASSAEILDINTATLSEIESLPRVGPVLGRRILEWREDHGPFAQASDIDAVPGIGPALLAGILPLIVAE